MYGELPSGIVACSAFLEDLYGIAKTPACGGIVVVVFVAAASVVLFSVVPKGWWSEIQNTLTHREHVIVMLRVVTRQNLHGRV